MSNTSSMASMAACPQLPYGLPKEPREVRSRHQRPSGATDIVAIGDDPTLSVYLAGLFEKSGWTIARARTCEEGASFLSENRTAVAVCEQRLPDGFWHDAAFEVSSIPDAPALVVVGDDESILHEVLALGGFDVLVRPLRERDVVWTIASAWHAWMTRFKGREDGAP